MSATPGAGQPPAVDGTQQQAQAPAAAPPAAPPPAAPPPAPATGGNGQTPAAGYWEGEARTAFTARDQAKAEAMGHI